MSDKFPFQCPGCQARIVLPASAAGKKGKCPTCGAVVEITFSATADAAAPAATQEAAAESLGHEGTFAGEHDAPLEVERSVGDQVTGSDKSQGDAGRSLGDKSTSGDALSSFSDLDGSIDELDDSIPLVDLSERYEIQGVLGQGGMGEVLRAFDKRLQRPVAIKRVLSKMAQSRKVLSRFLTEAQSIAALNHFNIVQIYDYGRDEEGPFIIMELVEGQSLLEKLKAGPLELEEAIELSCQLCDGLAVAHEQGIIHRDIKPANILLTKRGEPKLTDFGLARQDSVDHGQTQAGAVLGTIDFMPPEQRQDATAVDARSDLWSLAATLYQVLTGKSPRVIRLDQVAQSLRPVLGQALEDNPAERYPTAQELHTALRLVLTQPSSSAGSMSDDPFTEGRCPNCATVNDPSRKFCDSCGQPMQEACLSCGHLNGPWNRICGECGSNLQELITAKQAEIDEQKAAAESLRREYRYEEALQQLQELKELDHPRFVGVKSWAENNSSSLEAEHDQQIENLQVTTDEAIEEMDKGKFTEAIKLLEGVPAPLRDEKVLRLLERSQGYQQESERLLVEIKQQVATDNLTGLLDKTTRFLELSPGHPQVEKLHSQLQQRHQEKTVKVMGILARAKQLFDQHKDEAVLETLGECPEEFRQENGIQVFHAHATNRLARVRELDAAITAEANLDTKRRLVATYLELRPGHPGMKRLASVLQEQLQTQMLKAENRSQNKWVLIGLLCLFSVLALIVNGFFWQTASARRDAAVGPSRIAENVRPTPSPPSPPSPPDARPTPQPVDTPLPMPEAKPFDVEAIPEMAKQQRNKVEQRADGVFYVKGTDTPYSGKWHEVDSGAYGDATIKNGKLDGTFTWYRPNGSKAGEGIFRDGELVKGSEKWWNSKGEPVDSQAAARQPPVEQPQQPFIPPPPTPDPLMTRSILTNDHIVWSVSFSPDGKRIVSGSVDDTLKVWDVETGQELLTLKGHSDYVMSVSFSPDGKRIVSGSGDNTLKVWDVETGERMLTLEGHSDYVMSVSFSPDGKRIVSGSYDDTLKVWNAETGQELLTLKGHSSDVWSVSFSPDGNRIVSGSGDNTLKVWDVETGQELLTLKGHSDYVRSVSFSPDGNRIVSGSGDNTLKVWDAETGQEMLTLKGHSDYVMSVSFSPNGKRIASGSLDKTVKIWDADTGELARTIDEHSGYVRSVSFSPDGKRIVSGSGDKTIKIWKVPQ